MEMEDLELYLDIEPIEDKYLDITDDDFVNEQDDAYELDLWRDVTNELEELRLW